MRKTPTLQSTVTGSKLASGIAYAQSWEDPGVLVEGLRPGPEDDVLSIGAAGDNAFALAIAGARSVTLVDFNFPQLALAELKVAAARLLPLQSFRALLGLDPFGRRVWFYHHVRDALSEPARNYWDAHEDLLRAGVLTQGRFEQYFATFRERILPLVQSRDTVEAMLHAGSLEEQQRIFADRWDSRRWRLLFRVFFSEAVMARRGRSKEQFAQVESPVASRLLKRTNYALTQLPIADNYFLQWILGGGYIDLERTHPYLTTEGYRAFQAAARRGAFRFVHRTLEEVLAHPEGGAFSAFNYSDVFEYVPEAHFHTLLDATIHAARPGARILWWNLFVPRHPPARFRDRLTSDPALAARLHAQDRAFFYDEVCVETVR